MSYLPKFARVIAFAGVHMLTPAWGQTQDASMGGTALAMTEIAKGELKRGDRLMAEATPPAPSHSGPPDRCDGPSPCNDVERHRDRDRHTLKSARCLARLHRRSDRDHDAAVAPTRRSVRRSRRRAGRANQ